MVFCCLTMLMTSLTSVVSARELEGNYNHQSGIFPVVRNYTWKTLTEVVNTQQTSKYFVITAMAGDKTEKLYISFPVEGGFRIQSMHDAEIRSGKTTPSTPTAGLFEPDAIQTIEYKTTNDNVLVMKATDGTVLQYEQSGKDFKLWVCESTGKRVVHIGSGQISYAYSTVTEDLVVRTMVEMPLIEKEAIQIGSGASRDTNQIGETISLTVTDGWAAPDYMYIVNPLYHSNRGYSMWFNMPYMGKQDCGEDNPDKMTITFDSTDTSIEMDIRFWAGTPLENLKKYTDITGRSGVSPTWTYSYWSGACDIAWRQSAAEGAESDPRRSKEPVDNVIAMVEEYYNTYGFYPKVMGVEHHGENALILNYLKQRGIRAIDWYHPTATPDDVASYLANETRVPTSGSAGWPFPLNTDLLRNKGVYQLSENWDYIDYSNPNAYTVAKGVLRQQHELGLKGFMLDFGEWSNLYGTFYNGLTATGVMHNLNSYYYGQTLYNVHRDQFGNDFILYQRSGTPGSQQFAGNFLGDQSSDWDGYMDTVHMLINLGAGGWNLYLGHMGGASGHRPTNDLWGRWVALSVFEPYMAKHGMALKFPASDFDALAKKSFGNYYYFRENLVPTIEGAAIDANKTSNPIIKGMMAAYPYQLPLADVDNQYLFCDDFLVCAVTKETTCYQQVALPKGSTWYDLYSYRAYKGGQVMVAEAPAGTLPVFVKGGAVKAINLPESMTLGEKMFDDSGDEFQAIPALLVTAPDNKRENTIYVKDGESKDYHTYDSHTEVYNNTPGDNSTFTITNAEGSPREIMLALGVTAASVTVDGKALSYLDHTPNYVAYEYGFTLDRQGMTTIYAPKGWKEITIQKGDAKYTPLAMDADSNQYIFAMFDDKADTQYTLPKNGSDVTVALKEAADIDRVVLRWATGFYENYDIEYSADASNWELLPIDDDHTVVNGCGSIDIIDFETLNAKYLRLVPQKIGDGDVNCTPALYAFEVYAETELEVLGILPPSDDDIGNENDNWTDDEWEEWEEIIEEEIVPGNNKPNKIIRVISYIPWWGYLLVGLGALVLIGTIILLILLNRKRKKAEEALENNEESPIDFPEVQ